MNISQFIHYLFLCQNRLIHFAISSFVPKHHFFSISTPSFLLSVLLSTLPILFSDLRSSIVHSTTWCSNPSAFPLSIPPQTCTNFLQQFSLFFRPSPITFSH